MKRRILGLFFAAVLCFSLIPMAVHVSANENEYDVWVNGNTVNGVQITPTNKDDVLGDGTVSYDPTTNTVTLNNATITRLQSYVDSDLTVVVKGNCVVNCNEDAHGIELIAQRNLTIAGDGNLTVNGGSWALNASGGDLTIKGSTKVTINSAVLGFKSGNNVTITESASVTITGSNTGIQTKNDIIFSGSGAVSIEAESMALLTDDGGSIQLNGTGPISLKGGLDEEKISGSSLANYYKLVDSSTGVSFTTSYPVWVSGVQATATNKTDVLGDGKVSYDPITGTLTLGADVSITGTYTDGSVTSPTALIFSANDLIINAPNGLNLENIMACGIYVKTGNLTVNGDVNITVANANLLSVIETGSNGVTINGNVNIQFIGDAAEVGYSAIDANDNIVITGDVNIENFIVGLEASGSILVNGSATIETLVCGMRGNAGIRVDKDLYVTSSAPVMYAHVIYSENGSVSIGGNATIQYIGSDDEKEYDAILAYKDIMIAGDVDIDGFEYGLFAKHGDIKVDGNASINTSFYGMASGGTITMVSGKWDISSESVAMNSDTGIIIPETHIITTPEDGKVEKVTVETLTPGVTYSYYSVATTDNKPAEHVIIEVKPAPEYAVTFNMNGHGDQVAAQTVKEGEKVVKSADPTASGYTFDGWYTDAAFSAKFDFETAINADTTVYAKWTEIPVTPPAPATYTVTFNMNGHGDQIAAQTVKEGEKAVKPADPTANGYTFEGWYTDAAFSAKYDFDSTIKADTTIYAKWTVKTEATKDPTRPDTGDNNRMFLWITLLIVSSIAMVSTGMYGRKRKYNE